MSTQQSPPSSPRPSPRAQRLVNEERLAELRQRAGASLQKNKPEEPSRPCEADESQEAAVNKSTWRKRDKPDEVGPPPRRMTPDIGEPGVPRSRHRPRPQPQPQPRPKGARAAPNTPRDPDPDPVIDVGAARDFLRDACVAFKQSISVFVAVFSIFSFALTILSILWTCIAKIGRITIVQPCRAIINVLTVFSYPLTISCAVGTTILFILAFIFGIIAWMLLMLDQSENVAVVSAAYVVGFLGYTQGDLTKHVHLRVCPVLPFGGQVPVLAVFCPGADTTMKEERMRRQVKKEQTAKKTRKVRMLGLGSEEEWEAIFTRVRAISTISRQIDDISNSWEQVEYVLRTSADADVFWKRPDTSSEQVPVDSPSPSASPSPSESPPSDPRLLLLKSIYALSRPLQVSTTHLHEIPGSIVALLSRISSTIKHTRFRIAHLDPRRKADAKELVREYLAQTDAILYFLEVVIKLTNTVLNADSEAKECLVRVWYEIAHLEAWSKSQLEIRRAGLGIGGRWTKSWSRSPVEQEQWENLQRAREIKGISLKALLELQWSLKEIEGSLKNFRGVLQGDGIQIEGRWGMESHVDGLDAQWTFFMECKQRLEGERHVGR